MDDGTSSEWRRLTLPGGKMSSDDRRRMVFPSGLASSYAAIFFSSSCCAGCGGSDLFLRSSGKSVKSPVACITRSDEACFSENDRRSGALAVVPAPVLGASWSHPLSPVSLPLSFPNALSWDAIAAAACCFAWNNSLEDPRRSPLDVALVGLPNGFCKERRLCRF